MSEQRNDRWRAAGLVLALVACVLGFVPRSFGALVLHAHTGHELHLHVVRAAEISGGSGSLADAPWHRHVHEHDEQDEHGPAHAEDPGDHEQIVVRLAAAESRAPSTVPAHAELSRAFAAAATTAAFVSIESSPHPHARPPPTPARSARGVHSILTLQRSMRC